MMTENKIDAAIEVIEREIEDLEEGIKHREGIDEVPSGEILLRDYDFEGGKLSAYRKASTILNLLKEVEAE